jgi:hypothetical protein
MFHRFSTWWRALSVVLLSLATVTWPSAAQAASTSTFNLIHQDSVATLNLKGTSHFSVTLGLAKEAQNVSTRVAIFPRIVERSQISPIISGSGASGSPLATSRVFTLDCPKDRSTTFGVGLYLTRPAKLRSPCTSVAPQLRLGCQGESCDGVYPLRITISTNGATSTKWSLIAVQNTRVVQPLQMVLIETIGPSSLDHRSESIATLNSLGRHPRSPVTLAGDYVTLNTVQQSGRANELYRTALSGALASPLHQIVSAPPSTIDFGGLDNNGLSSEVTQQIALSADIVKSVTGRYVNGPILLGGQPSLSSLRALARAKVLDVILPETSLTYPPSSTLNWGSPFRITGVASITALSTDTDISRLLGDTAIEPGRRAALALGSLAFLHFVAPNAPALRTVVLEASIESTSADLISSLLAGLAHNPFVDLAPLAPSFSTSLIGTNGAPTSRTLQSSSDSPRWSSHNISSLNTLVSQVTSYSQAVTSVSVADTLRVALAKSEISASADVRQSAINAASTMLLHQLGQFSVDPSAITLAGPGTALPITLLSRANYTVTAVVHLITDRLSFPKGRDIVITMDSPTKSLRVPTTNHRGSSLTLQVVVTTPDDQVVLARTAIQVRIAGTSIVGYLLTFASLFVLALWWWRTYRRRSKGRHAR